MKKTIDAILLASAIVSLISVIGIGVLQHQQYSHSYLD